VLHRVYIVLDLMVNNAKLQLQLVQEQQHNKDVKILQEQMEYVNGQMEYVLH
jgi:hypothetical protein